MAKLHDIGVATQIGTYSDGVEVPQDLVTKLKGYAG